MTQPRLVTTATRVDPALLPPVTEAHRLAAFESLRMKNATYEAAMRDTVLRKIIDTRAATLRTREFNEANQASQRLVKRCRTLPDGTERWATQRVPGPVTAQAALLKAGDAPAPISNPKPENIR